MSILAVVVVVLAVIGGGFVGCMIFTKLVPRRTWTKIATVRVSYDQDGRVIGAKTLPEKEA